MLGIYFVSRDLNFLHSADATNKNEDVMFSVHNRLK